MRSANTPAKIIVLAVFILLMGSFVAYRSGALDKYLYGSPKGAELSLNSLNANPADTSGRPDTTPTKTMMYGSKSAIMTGPLYADKLPPMSIGTDTAAFLDLYRTLNRIKNQNLLMQEQLSARKQQMSSSKFIILVNPKEEAMLYNEPVLLNDKYKVLTLQQIDSLIKEMDIRYPQFAQPDSMKEKPVMMSGSKSLFIIDPAEIKKIEKKMKKQQKKEKKNID